MHNSLFNLVMEEDIPDLLDAMAETVICFLLLK